MNQAKGAAVAVVALIIGLVIGLVIPFGQVEPTITETHRVTTTQVAITKATITETVTQGETITKTQTSTMLQTESKTTTVIQTVKTSSTSTQFVRKTMTIGPAKPLVILSDRGWLDDYGYYQVQGVVQNQDLAMTLEFVKVQAIFYDDTGAFVASDYTYADPSTLSPGEKGIFEFMISDDEGSLLIASYELQVSYTP